MCHVTLVTCHAFLLLFSSLSLSPVRGWVAWDQHKRKDFASFHHVQYLFFFFKFHRSQINGFIHLSVCILLLRLKERCPPTNVTFTCVTYQREPFQRNLGKFFLLVAVRLTQVPSLWLGTSTDQRPSQKRRNISFLS